MSTILQAANIPDLVATTLNDLGPLRFQQIAQSIQYYEVFPRWFKRDRVTFDSGIGIRRTLMNKFDSSAAAHVGLNHVDTVTIPDVIDQLSIDWVHAQAQWALFYQTDILMNAGKSLVLNVVEPRRASALLALVEELEDKAWGDAPSTTNVVDPNGIQYYIVESASDGFNGEYPGSHTDVAGVNLTTTPNYKNYTVRYTDVSKADLIKDMRTMHRKIRFRSPITVNDYRGGIGDTYRIYTNESVISAMETLGESQNENLGRDLASMDGTMTFHRNPIIWIPKLDERTDGPIYMVDHSTFYPVVLKGDYLRESEARQVQGQHNMFQIFIDLSYNYLCIDRRRNGVCSTA